MLGQKVERAWPDWTFSALEGRAGSVRAVAKLVHATAVLVQEAARLGQSESRLLQDEAFGLTRRHAQFA